ncbi:MAG TPA: DUF167 domain-containing protein [Nitrospirales bacterium]|nr:DUF167 domain-containing protein [Nitrospirales bacterium]HIA13928.1 DUF167 domain-containing protein [Nitrospirales bacterium]HIB54099.1 DUF167 domain-containing protein [Nitrospirales bacterium]HIC05214.1 DUF167 domain-containing protein [Nitrospirales bacterium]HIN33408.1 DUF167 domain-containing protein [Nitrospirales bacterium]
MGRPSVATSKISTVVTVRILPRAHRDKICGVVDGIIQLRVSAPPVDGKANAGCIALLSKALGMPASAVQIIRGERSRIKFLRIQGMSEQEILKKLG